LDQSYVRRALLGIRRLHGSHTGENQCAILFKLLEEYGILHKLGYFTLDNARNNDVTLRHLAECLKDI